MHRDGEYPTDESEILAMFDGAREVVSAAFGAGIDLFGEAHRTQAIYSGLLTGHALTVGFLYVHGHPEGGPKKARQWLANVLTHLSEQAENHGIDLKLQFRIDDEYASGEDV